MAPLQTDKSNDEAGKLWQQYAEGKERKKNLSKVLLGLAVLVGILVTVIGLWIVAIY